MLLQVREKYAEILFHWNPHTVPIVAVNSDPNWQSMGTQSLDIYPEITKKKKGYWVNTWGLEIQLYVSK